MTLYPQWDIGKILGGDWAMKRSLLIAFAIDEQDRWKNYYHLNVRSTSIVWASPDHIYVLSVSLLRHMQGMYDYCIAFLQMALARLLRLVQCKIHD